MNCVQQQDRPFRMAAVFVAALVVLTLAGSPAPAEAQTYKVLYDFLVGGPGPQWPGGPLAQGRDGHLYGYSYDGGVNNDGSIWKTTLSGTVNVIYSFNTPGQSDCQNGMTLGTDGNFYGTALTNCTGPGYVFKLTPSGTLSVLHTFTGTPDGSGPGLLVQYTDGNFYGVTGKGGANNYGTVFKVTPTGTLTTLYSFVQANPFPTYGLTVGSDGNFYGTTGASAYPGGVFKVTPAGVLTVLHTFVGAPNDGDEPFGGVTLGQDGNFYGTTRFGGADNQGTIFKITPSGAVTLLHSFNVNTDYANYPQLPLLQATDGNFYSGDDSCSEFGCGTQDLYKVTPSGTFTVLEKFTGSNGQWPYWPLTQDTNGTLYGLAQQGGTVNGGVLFSLTIGAKPFVSLVSTSGKEGAKIGILGQGFSSASVVEFGGVQATTVKRTGKTFIFATVPVGALSGSVTVTTGSKMLISPHVFKVKPTFLSFSPASGTVGTPVVITGTGLTQTTKVTFGGVAATTVVVNSDSQVTAKVPTGAVTGKIVIRTKGGSAASKTDFTVK